VDFWFGLVIADADMRRAQPRIAHDGEIVPQPMIEQRRPRERGPVVSCQVHHHHAPLSDKFVVV